jgi:hypothetical protein
MVSNRAKELKTRLAAVNYGVSEQNSSQQAIGPGAREVSDKTTNNETGNRGTPEKQNATQQSIHNEGGQRKPKNENKNEEAHASSSDE